jgi:hypothetical protein
MLLLSVGALEHGMIMRIAAPVEQVDVRLSGSLFSGCAVSAECDDDYQCSKAWQIAR